MERKKKILKTDRRWAWLEIDRAALRHNINEAKRTIGGKCKLLCVVKADAYGHGAVKVAEVATKCGAAYLGVSNVDEGVQLREGGIKLPILVFSQPPDTAIPVLLKYHIMPSIYTTEFAIKYAEDADRRGMEAPYHLAVNTGMNRIGVRYNEVLDFLKLISFHRALKLEGTFTHFATADEADLMDFRRQYSFFSETIARMKNAGINPCIVHCANSAALFRFPETHFDMVRLGICMYGSYPCADIRQKVQLKPVMSVHARIHDERILGLGEGVSYGMKYRARSAVKICAIPVGYADGLRRSFSGKIDVLYKGNRFPQVGNICMDQCMFEIDLNSGYAQDNFDAQIGEDVVIMGSQGGATITIDELADVAGTISYEIMCGFSMRMPRIYV